MMVGSTIHNSLSLDHKHSLIPFDIPNHTLFPYKLTDTQHSIWKSQFVTIELLKQKAFICHSFSNVSLAGCKVIWNYFRNNHNEIIKLKVWNDLVTYYPFDKSYYWFSHTTSYFFQHILFLLARISSHNNVPFVA